MLVQIFHIITVALLAFSTPASASEIWLTGVDSATWQKTNTTAPQDYMDLFQPNAPWAKAAAHVNVFKVSTQFLARASDETLSQVFADLKRRGIALAFEALILTGDGTCGRGVEGYEGPKLMEIVAKRVRRLGGELRYVAMDEPLWFGHRYTGPNACRSSIAAVAQDVATKVAAIRRVFPDVKIGDIEPVASLEAPDWIDQIMAWTKAYEQAVGEPLDFFHADMQWRAPWPKDLMLLAERLKAAGIKFGIIYNGDPRAPSDEAWTARAEERFVAVEGGLGLAPAQAILQSWMTRPTRMLPETQPGTMTSLVNRYVAEGTVLTVERRGSRLAGSLSSATGRAIAGAAVTVLAVDNGRAGIAATRTLAGSVPPEAASATLGLRLNVECNCAARANVRLGPLHYREDRSGLSVQRDFVPPATLAKTGRRIVADPAQPVLINTPTFPVTAGDSYVIEIPMQAAHASSDTGYVAIIFFDQQGKALKRDLLWIEPTTETLATLTTDGSGHFSLPLDDARLASRPGYLVRYGGSDSYRLSSIFLE